MDRFYLWRFRRGATYRASMWPAPRNAPDMNAANSAL